MQSNHSEDSCYGSNRQGCDDHFGCEVFFCDEAGIFCNEAGVDATTSSTVSSSEQSPISAGSTSKSVVLDAFQAEIEDACSEESLVTFEGISNCWNHCQAHLCCFTADVSLAKGDCSEKYPNECDAYSVCESLVSTYNKWNPPSTLNDHYAVKKAVDEKCRLTGEDLSPEWVSGCHQVCQDKMCCLADPATQSNCYDLIGKNTCDDYEACENLIAVHYEDEEGEDIDQVCNNQVQTDKNLFAECESSHAVPRAFSHRSATAPGFEACKTRSCCFEEKESYSCYGMETAWCSQYAACNQVGFDLPSDMEESGPPPEVDFAAIDQKCERHYLLSFGSEEWCVACTRFSLFQLYHAQYVIVFSVNISAISSAVSLACSSYIRKFAHIFFSSLLTFLQVALMTAMNALTAQ